MPITILLWILLFIVSYALIYYSADKFIDYLKDLSILLKVSPFLIGLLILGIDPEESIASIIAAINGLPEIAIGNVIGNSIISIAFCFSLPALFSNLKFEKIPLYYPFLIILSTLMILISALLPYNMIFVGVVSLLIFGIYLTRNLNKYKKSKTVDIIIDDDEDDDDENEEEDEDESNIEEKGENHGESKRTKKKAILILKIFAFFSLILLGGEGLIFATENILSETGIDESFFGFIVIAFVTNVEEITLLFKSIKKNQISIGIGGMIGKIIWNMGFTLGISALIIMEIPFTSAILYNSVLLLVLGIYFAYLINNRQITKKDGIILSIVFILFIMLNIFLGLL
ncbi:MAG: sodium:calcium antiporter [Promethearchaeota archaeon]